MITRVKMAYLPKWCNSCKRFIWLEDYGCVRFVRGVHCTDAILCKNCTNKARECFGLEPLFGEIVDGR